MHFSRLLFKKKKYYAFCKQSKPTRFPFLWCHIQDIHGVFGASVGPDLRVLIVGVLTMYIVVQGCGTQWGHRPKGDRCSNPDPHADWGGRWWIYNLQVIWLSCDLNISDWDIQEEIQTFLINCVIVRCGYTYSEFSYNQVFPN